MTMNNYNTDAISVKTADIVSKHGSSATLKIVNKDTPNNPKISQDILFDYFLDDGRYWVMNNRTYYQPYKKTTAKRMPEAKRLAEMPIYPLALIVDRDLQTNRTSLYLKLWYRDAIGEENTLCVSMESLAKKDKKDGAISELMSHGFTLFNTRGTDLADVLRMVSITAFEKKDISVLEGSTKTGWTVNKGEHITPSSDHYLGKEASYMSVSGSKDIWIDTQRKIFETSPVTAFIVTSAISGYLRGMIKAENSPIFDLWGQSSQGKTLAAYCAVSWIGPIGVQGGNYNSWESTKVARENILSIRSNSFALMDEISGMKDKFSATDQLMALANGGSRSAAKMDGSLRAAKTWQNVIISTSNISIDSLIDDSHEQADALRARVINIDIDQYPLWQNGFGELKTPMNLERLLDSNYGHGYHDVIKYIKAHSVELENKVTNLQDKYFSRFENNVIVARRAKEIAFTLAACDVVENVIGDGSTNNVKSFCETLLNSWQQEQPHREIDKVDDIRDSILAIMSHYNSSLKIDGYWFDPDCPNQEQAAKYATRDNSRSGYKVYLKQNSEMKLPFDVDGMVCIAKTEQNAIKKALGIDLKALAQRAKYEGMLHTNKGRSDFSCSPMNKMRTYAFKLPRREDTVQERIEELGDLINEMDDTPF
ncbi:hypothetical protein BCT17_21525 [Vibrio sp. 10N.222.54.F10]|nr:hypothetical protein BCT17_21525 [Vibrio sp. 10N.222.54.F10]